MVNIYIMTYTLFSLYFSTTFRYCYKGFLNITAIDNGILLTLLTFWVFVGETMMKNKAYRTLFILSNILLVSQALITLLSNFFPRWL